MVRVHRYPGVPGMKAFARTMLFMQIVTLPLAGVNFLCMLLRMGGGGFGS
jgi:hypothetical protein